MPINWPEFRKALRSELSGKIDDQQRIRIIAQDVGLSAANVNFHDAPLVVWHSLIDYAMTQQAVPDLIREAQQRLPKNQCWPRWHSSGHPRRSGREMGQDHPR